MSIWLIVAAAVAGILAAVFIAAKITGLVRKRKARRTVNTAADAAAKNESEAHDAISQGIRGNDCASDYAIAEWLRRKQGHQ